MASGLSLVGAVMIFYVTFIFVFVHRMRDELAALSKNASLCVSRQQM